MNVKILFFTKMLLSLKLKGGRRGF